MTSTAFTVATWNVNSLRVREEQVAQWLTQHQPDVLCLQETKVPDEEFPFEVFETLGYHCAVSGQKSYNGVALISRAEPQQVEYGFADYEDEQKRVIAADFLTEGGQAIKVVNVYVPNGQSLDSEKFIYKTQWFEALKRTMAQTLASHDHTVLVGDFNITPSDLDVHDPSAWRGKIHCSESERLMLHSLMAEGLYDTYRQHQPLGEHFSWWDYRGAGYRANAGLRIDLILSSAALLTKSTCCEIDEAPRKLERPSDHTPVIAQFQC